jgi:tetratricopeptide (TPR) repeat protein
MKKFWLLLPLIFFVQPALSEAKKAQKGLLPEVQLDSTNEEENDARAATSEILITRAENKAIDSLQNIIKKKKGSTEEADLWYRLAELYMRRSKSGRFFDLQVAGKGKQLSSFPIPNEKGSDWIKKAIGVYSHIENDFKSYREMDSVLFNNAFAHQQVGKIKEAQGLYERMLARFPNSALVPDSLVALGELYYDQRKFTVAMDFLTRLEKHPDSRVFPYAMYKLAWTHYNLSDTSKGVKRLLQVVEMSPAGADGEDHKNKQNLRREALRDLTIFIGDTTPADELVMVFAKITKDEEFGQAMTDLARLYDGHSRYKDMNIFLPEFMRRDPDNAYVVKAHLSLVDANENLKLRDKVIEHLKIASDLCITDSKWRLKNKKEITDESCGHDFQVASKDIAEKWWDIWLKNKQHKEFTALTEKALKIIIDHEERNAPDLKTHYAYAELLFALERFDEASEQYKNVGDNLTSDAKIQHDATYAALFAKEKSIAQLGKEKSPLKEGERKELALNYVKKYPKGAQAADVTMKLAVIYYEEGNYEEGQKWLKPGLEGQLGKEFQAKAEDLQLDILNIKKDYVSIQKLAKKVIAGSKDSARVANLTRILQEASYAEIQDDIKNDKKVDGAAKLVQFSTDQNQSKLAPDALWQAVSLYFSEVSSTKGADTAVVFATRFPNDKRSPDALKEAAKTYAENGYLLKAAETLKKIADTDKKDHNADLELAADFYSLEKKDKEARAIYNSLLANADAKTKSRLFSKILQTYPEKSGSEFDKLQNSVLSMNIEPYATQILFDRLKLLVEKKKSTEAFDLAKKIMSRDTTPLFKAKARLVQAKILEQELISQSLKSSREDRFAMILGMKTEKLDKAQTAYLSASKLSPDAQIQMTSLSGIDRCYANYVESLKNVQFPATLSAEDQAHLRTEMGKIVAEIENKRKDNSSQLKKLAKVQLVEKSKGWNLEEISTDQTLAPLVHYPEPQQMHAYLPANDELLFSKMERLEGRTSTACVNKPVTADFRYHQAMATCFSSRDIKEMEKIAYSLVESRDHKQMGLYYLGLVAELQGAFEKSLYFMELSLKSRNDAPLFAYQKARMVYQTEGLAPALPFFDKVLDMQMSSTETETFSGIKSYIEGDFETVILKLSKLSADQMYNLGVGPLITESYAQKGQIDKALKLADDLLAKASKSLDAATLELVLQKARILETYKLAPLPALEAYEKARKIVKEEELKNWLDRKVELLKNQNKSRAARTTGRLEI